MRLVDVGGRLVELHIRRSKRVNGHRLYVRQGLPPSSSCGRARSDSYIDDAIAMHKAWLERQLANVTEPCLGLERLHLTEQQGRREAQARISLIAQSEAAALGVAYTRLTLARPAQPLGLVLEQGRAELQLAARARTARRARLRRRARGLSSRRASPRAAFWELVERRRPEYLESKNWLDEPRVGAARVPPAARGRCLRSGCVERWASFDCYGTLIDWDGGVRAELARVFGEAQADELLARYHERRARSCSATAR